MAGLVSPSVKIGPAGSMAAGLTHRPMPESARGFHGNLSPGSRLRAGATSEWASTRSAGRRWRGGMLGQRGLHSAHSRFRKGGIAMVMSGIGDLDADRARIDVALPRPR